MAAWTWPGCAGRSLGCRCPRRQAGVWSWPRTSRPGCADAATAPDRSFRHTYGRGEGKHQMIPGWPYSVIAALETGRTSWTAPLDAIRLEPGADIAAVTTAQIHDLVERLVAAEQWTDGDPYVLIVLDAGYDAPRIAHLLEGLPVEILGRMRCEPRPSPADPAPCL